MRGLCTHLEIRECSEGDHHDDDDGFSRGEKPVISCEDLDPADVSPRDTNMFLMHLIISLDSSLALSKLRKGFAILLLGCAL